MYTLTVVSKTVRRSLKERPEDGGEATDYTEGETSVLPNCVWYLDL